MDDETQDDPVHDFESFLRFAYALAAERERAEQMEHDQPELYRWTGTLGWQTSFIATFLECALRGFEAQWKSRAGDPTWADVADLLYLGKLHE